MILKWTERSRRHLLAIHDYIGRDDPRAARAVLGSIHEAAQRLAEAPLMGRPGRVDGIRELIILHTPYLIAYRVTEAQVELLAALHAARRWPERL